MLWLNSTSSYSVKVLLVNNQNNHHEVIEHDRQPFAQQWPSLVQLGLYSSSWSISNPPSLLFSISSRLSPSLLPALILCTNKVMLACMQVYRFWLTISGTAMHLLKQSSRYFHTSCETILHTVSTETCSLSHAGMRQEHVTEMLRVLLSLEAMRDFAGKKRHGLAWQAGTEMTTHMFLWPFELARILSFTKAYGKCYSKKATIVSSWLALHILHSHCYLRLGGMQQATYLSCSWWRKAGVQTILITLLPLFFFCTKELERHSSKSFLSTMMHDPARFSEPNPRYRIHVRTCELRNPWIAQLQSTDCPRKARIHALRSAIHGLSPILGLRTTYIIMSVSTQLHLTQ